MEKLTVTRGLSTLKLLEKRIHKKAESTFISVNISDQTNSSDIKGNYDSIMDLIKYRNDLKAAIMLSNAKTIVTINNEEMSVAEAIDRKSSIAYLKLLVNSLKEQLMDARMIADNHNRNQESRLDALLEANFGSDTKHKAENFKTIADEFWKKNKADLIDPLDLQKKIETLTEEIDNFENEVDLVLSESNATTFLDL